MSTLLMGSLLMPGAAYAEAEDIIAAAVDQLGATASVPLHVEGFGLGQPVVDVSIGGGEFVPLALDTGSHGLVISLWELPADDIWNALEHFSFDNINVGAFPAGITVGLDVPTSVDFGGGVVAEDTVVNGLLFSSPFSAIGAQALAGAPVAGILGIGPNAGGSGDLVTDDLPGELGKGVLIDEPGGRLVFGAQPDTVRGADPIATLDGAPFPGGAHTPDQLQIQIHDWPMQTVGAVFDTGGKGGWIPSDVWWAMGTTPGDKLGALLAGLDFDSIPGGTPISVYTPDGQLLYSYVTTGASIGGMQAMPNWLMKALVGIEGVMNTGNAAFAHNPVYISNAGGGAMTFYGPATGPGGGTVEP